MRKKNTLIFIFIGTALFFVGLTIYVNRILLPIQVKKIAITQAQRYLKRRVDISSIHFSWVKGFVLEGVTVNQKDSSETLFKAERINLGVIFIPGFKQHQLTFPYITVEKPYVRLQRLKDSTWNFSDLLGPNGPVENTKTNNSNESLLL